MGSGTRLSLVGLTKVKAFLFTEKFPIIEKKNTCLNLLSHLFFNPFAAMLYAVVKYHNQLQNEKIISQIAGISASVTEMVTGLSENEKSCHI